MKYAMTVNTPLGEMTLTEENGALIRADFGRPPLGDAQWMETPLEAGKKEGQIP